MPSPLSHDPQEAARSLAERVRAQRLAQNLSQSGLAERAGMSLSSYKRFESSGQIALLSLLRVALVLGALDGFEQLFPEQEFRSIDQVLRAAKGRQRGTRS